MDFPGLGYLGLGQYKFLRTGLEENLGLGQ